MFRINPFKNSREEKHMPNNVRASARIKPITVSQPHVITKKDVNSNSNGLSSIGVDNTAKTRRTQPRSNTKNTRVPSVFKSSCRKNKEVDVEEHLRDLLISKNKKHMSSECNNVKLATQNVYSNVVCAMCKQCLISIKHDVCLLNYVNDMNSRGKKQKAMFLSMKNKRNNSQRVILFSIHSDEWKSFQSQHQIALRGSKTLSWKPCQGGSSKIEPTCSQTEKTVPVEEGSLETTTEGYMENYKNVSQGIRNQLDAEVEAIQIILTGIDNDIYSTVDACPNACAMWKAIKRSQQAAISNRGKSIVNSPTPTYDQEPAMVADNDKMSKEKKIDKLMALISLSFNKIYKPTIKNLRTSSNTSRANQDNTLRINKGTGEHLEQPESVNDIYPDEQGDTNIPTDSLDISNNGGQADQDEDDDLARDANQLMFKDLKKFQAKLDRTKIPMAMPISTSESKRTVNQSVATPLKKTVAECTNQKPKRKIRKLYEQISKTCKWWYSKITPPGYEWKPKSSAMNVKQNISLPLGKKSRNANTLEPMTLRKSNMSNTPLSSNCFAPCTVKFGNDQIAPILGYGDLVQDTFTPNPIFLMAKASSSQAWLWHRRLSHLNFDTINLLSKDGENLDKMKEKGDACIFVGYSTQSRAYMFNLRPQSQKNVPQAAETVTMSNELDLLFSLMFDELLNETTPVVSKSFAVPAADIPDQPGSEIRPPMLNKENYVPWSSRFLRYAKSRPNGKLIHNSIINGLYVRRMILEPGDTNREVPVNETSHVQTDDEVTKKELKQIEADDQAIQTILLGLSEDIYAAVDSYETAQEIWLRVQQMMKGSDIGIEEKKAKLFNEWERFTSNDEESIESYYHRFLKLMNDLKQNKHFPEKIASNLKFLNNLQPEWSRHKEVDELKAERLAKTQDPLALLATSNNPYNFPVLNQDQPSFNQNYMQQPMPNPVDITYLTTAMNMALALMAKAFKLNYSTPTNNNQRISSNPRNTQIAQPGMNMGQDRQMQMVGGNANQNLNGNGNLVAARTEGNAAGHKGNQIKCYNCRGVGYFARNCTVRPRRRDAAYLQTQLLIGQKEEPRIQLQAEEFDLMAAASDLYEIKEYTELLKPIPESYQVSQNDNNVISEDSSVEQSGGSVEQHPANVKETRALYDSLYQNLAIEVEKVDTVNCKLKETNADLTTEL
nr:hypothetical protein [Tanacetum cinerariifolium]